jgi:hypothetical protein
MPNAASIFPFLDDEKLTFAAAAFGASSHGSRWRKAAKSGDTMPISVLMGAAGE